LGEFITGRQLILPILIGPSIAGVLIAAVGEGCCFLIDGISYVAVVVSLAAMRALQPPQFSDF